MANICVNTVKISKFTEEQKSQILKYIDEENFENVITVLKNGMEEFRVYLDNYTVSTTGDEIIWSFESAWGTNPAGFIKLSDQPQFRNAVLSVSAEYEDSDDSFRATYSDGIEINAGDNPHNDVRNHFLSQKEELQSNLDKITNISEILDEKDAEEEIFDFDQKMECYEEPSDMVQSRIEGVLEAIDLFNSKESISYNDIDVCSITSLDEEDDAWESLDVAPDDTIDVADMKTIVDDIIEISNNFITNYTNKIDELFYKDNAV